VQDCFVAVLWLKELLHNGSRLQRAEVTAHRSSHKTPSPDGYIVRTTGPGITHAGRYRRACSHQSADGSDLAVRLRRGASATRFAVSPDGVLLAPVAPCVTTASPYRASLPSATPEHHGDDQAWMRTIISAQAPLLRSVFGLLWQV